MAQGRTAILVLLFSASVGAAILVAALRPSPEEAPLGAPNGPRAAAPPPEPYTEQYYEDEPSPPPPPEPDPPAGIPAPPFSLIDSHGRRVDPAALRGRVWIADFIFTRCFNTCPLMTAEFAKLQARLRQAPGWEDVRLVSFTVDPGYDTPAVLADYAVPFAPEPDHWLFLTGEPAHVRRVVEEGWGIGIGANIGEFMPSLHSTRIALVDRSGTIRGWYDGLSAADRQRLMEDIQTLLAEPAKR